MVIGGRGCCGGWKDCDRDSRVRFSGRKLRSTREAIFIRGEKRGNREFDLERQLILHWLLRVRR